MSPISRKGKSHEARDKNEDQAPGGSDDAPCDSEYTFTGPTFSVSLEPIRAWRLMRLIAAHKVEAEELEAISSWPH